MFSGTPVAESRSSIRVVVVGDHGTGKSSLIAAAASESFLESVPSVLPSTCLPADYFEGGVPVIIIDTSSSLEGKAKLEEESMWGTDVIVLTYACDKPETLDSLQNFWIHEIRRLKVKVPVIVVGCKSDLIDEYYPMSKEQVADPIMQQYTEIEVWRECSAAKLDQASIYSDVY
ncbi:hypothetical protein CTI12_AA572890 [Artemisia annua]|uniref:Miro domain-containing protein n=1 Tax=Artemisia annua TaxID=35608 RepID=A0A2U1KRE7_ARTAN|nr:hypothetical protein CTI12_AA572890 [Artemisia annua]